jgi:bacterioferritin
LLDYTLADNARKTLRRALDLDLVRQRPFNRRCAMDKEKVVAHLDKVLEAELSGVVRYLHYSFMVFGPNRIPITKWFRDHALEGFNHAVIIGEKITALGGHPSVKVQPVPETNKHNVLEILKEGLAFEKASLNQYLELLSEAEGDVALEELIRQLIKEETSHIEEVEKMTRVLDR